MKTKRNTLQRQGATTAIKLSKMTAKTLGISPKLTWAVVQVFLSLTSEMIDQGTPVWLRGLGSFFWKPLKGSKGRVLRFNATAAFRRGRANDDGQVRGGAR